MKSREEVGPYIAELDRLYDDASYSSQTYFEAAKSAEFWGRGIVFIPALLAAAAALLVSLGEARAWGAVGAIAGSVAATASFLGSERRANSLKESARRFTVLRHATMLERNLALQKSEHDLEQTVRSLRDQYAAIVSATDLAGNRFFERAQKRIKSGVLEYEAEQEVKTISPLTKNQPSS
jgi:gas vesicle protein